MEPTADKPKTQFSQSDDGTLYWTVSLYIDPACVRKVLGDGDPVEKFRAFQFAHRPSFDLASAINPLFNDIADRAILGKINEFLFVADDEDSTKKRAVNLTMPASIAWTTEGTTFRAEPLGLDRDRTLDLKRFWFTLDNGGMIYNLSFKYHYAASNADAYSPATYYTISALQKLGSPKEFALDAAHVESLRANPDHLISVFDQEKLGIAPHDEMLFGENRTRFWHFVRDLFDRDAGALFARTKLSGTKPAGDSCWHDVLLQQQALPEVPGLKMPRGRFLFHFQDKRFFDRLAPVSETLSDAMARKAMVQDPCYAPYQQEMKKRLAAAKAGQSDVQLGIDYWNWVGTRGEYLHLIKSRSKNAMRITRHDGGRIVDWDDLVAKMRGDGCVFHDGLGKATNLQILAFAAKRTDCLDYLFLSGFNQNIIDFMNQDTSEILDSIDPLYPDQEDQAIERFFVRYANHKSMITYVRESRSLEAGDDYIGTCPYAFLIHANAMHNEYLAEDHELASARRVGEISGLLANGRSPLEKIESLVNSARKANYQEYERFVHDNPFRYDTERDVFTKLEKLRGINRKQFAINKVVESLDIEIADLQRQQRQRESEDESYRALILNVLLGSFGVFGALQLFYQIAQQNQDGIIEIWPWISLSGRQVMNFMEHGIFIFALAFIAPIAGIVFHNQRKKRKLASLANQEARTRVKASR
jgi:hypothetical protein